MQIRRKEQGFSSSSFCAGSREDFNSGLIIKGEILFTFMPYPPDSLLTLWASINHQHSLQELRVPLVRKHNPATTMGKHLLEYCHKSGYSPAPAPAVAEETPETSPVRGLLGERGDRLQTTALLPRASTTTPLQSRVYAMDGSRYGTGVTWEWYPDPQG